MIYSIIFIHFFPPFFGFFAYYYYLKRFSYLAFSMLATLSDISCLIFSISADNPEFYDLICLIYFLSYSC